MLVSALVSQRRKGWGHQLDAPAPPFVLGTSEPNHPSNEHNSLPHEKCGKN